MRRAVVVALLLALAGATAGCVTGRSATSGVETRAAAPGTAAPAGPEAEVAPRLTEAPQLTATDLAWLAAVDRLRGRMTAVFDDSPSAMTAATLRGLAGDLGACTRELSRLGTPSARLAPVHALAWQACREYDKGAACFADAAAARSASGVQHDLDCGFAAATRGGRPLADAGRQGEELRTTG